MTITGNFLQSIRYMHITKHSVYTYLDCHKALRAAFHKAQVRMREVLAIRCLFLSPLLAMSTYWRPALSGGPPGWTCSSLIVILEPLIQASIRVSHMSAPLFLCHKIRIIIMALSGTD